ncbi:LytR family transcriptional regulator [Nocardioides guangzhouensis]|uniref:LytR family transcriptional regulator n=1 Tax=Nocardioides guangzhouensis TaxID=2497878 RepID=A0A4V1XZM0_9ACTN|nr:LytR C-terminal domain-containing protein [Nocardioides guangzhouensis]RYP87219.1 LytR family transcriptional regulator [Nocardioides guangzhouensis]
MEGRARSAATLGVLVVLCLLGIWFGIRGLTADLPTDPLVEKGNTICEDRTIAHGTKIRAGEITVSVYNAGRQAGLASRVLRSLQARGFGPGETGNAPEGTKVVRAQVWADSKRNAAAKLVARQLGPTTKVFVNRPDIGVGVVVVLGDSFGKLAKAPTVTRAQGRTTICTPTEAAIS